MTDPPPSAGSGSNKAKTFDEVLNFTTVAFPLMSGNGRVHEDVSNLDTIVVGTELSDRVPKHVWVPLLATLQRF